MQWLIDLCMLFYPCTCQVCGLRLTKPSEVLCLKCEYNMPLTDYSLRIDNPVSKIFWGRVPVEMATALFRFEKGSGYQSVLHDLKYRGNKRTGIYLGLLLGHALKHTSFASCDLLIPVPIHRSRLRKRGYNQAAIIAEGVSRVLELPVEESLLIRSTHHDSQTTMGRLERFENVDGNFRMNPHHLDLNEKKILLIDDVVTTGATLETCSSILLNHYRCLVYIATIACA